MAPADKPTIVIVPGAWHSGPIHFQPLTTRLEAAGYEVHPMALPSIAKPGEEPEHIGDNTPDIRVIASTIERAADAGQDVVVVVHSAGGVTGGEACKNLSKTDRAKAGKAGGVVRLVYLAAFALPEGVTLHGATGGKPAPWQAVTETTVFPMTPLDTFYHDVDPDLARQAAAQLGKHSLKNFQTPVTYAAWKHIPSTYLICEADRAMPPAFQETMVKAEGANFTVERCSSAHSPWMSMPDYTAEFVRRAAGEKI